MRILCVDWKRGFASLPIIFAQAAEEHHPGCNSLLKESWVYCPSPEASPKWGSAEGCLRSFSTVLLINFIGKFITLVQGTDTSDSIPWRHVMCLGSSIIKAYKNILADVHDSRLLAILSTENDFIKKIVVESVMKRFTRIKARKMLVTLPIK